MCVVPGIFCSTAVFGRAMEDNDLPLFGPLAVLRWQIMKENVIMASSSNSTYIQTAPPSRSVFVFLSKRALAVCRVQSNDAEVGGYPPF